MTIQVYFFRTTHNYFPLWYWPYKSLGNHRQLPDIEKSTLFFSYSIQQQCMCRHWLVQWPVTPSPWLCYHNGSVINRNALDSFSGTCDDTGVVDGIALENSSKLLRCSWMTNLLISSAEDVFFHQGEKKTGGNRIPNCSELHVFAQAYETGIV